MDESRSDGYSSLDLSVIIILITLGTIGIFVFLFQIWGFNQNQSDMEKYRTPEEQKAFFEGYDVGYQEGYDAAKHNLSYGIVWEPFNFTCAEGKNKSERINKCIRD